MTTTISLAARDFIVVGCDSLATASMDMVFPGQIVTEFFDANDELKLGSDGKPLLKSARQVWERASSMPVNQLPSVTKLFKLDPAQAALLFAGTARIGETTVRNLVETFVSDGRFLAISGTGTVEDIAKCLNTFILEIFDREIPDEMSRPSLEVMMSGYSAAFREPEVWTLLFYPDRAAGVFKSEINCPCQRKEYTIVFGGQYDVIQRVVNGVDLASYTGLQVRTKEVLEECYAEIEKTLQASGYGGPVPKPNFSDSRYDLFAKNWGNVNRIFSDVGSLSEQAGIDFVYFLIDLMINAQEFSNSIPTVGGGIHVALLTKNDGFRWISKEGFTFEGQHVSKLQNHHNA